MITRDNVLSQACDDCIKEIYSFVQPSVEWSDFKKENEEYVKKSKEWDDWKVKNTSHPEWEGKSKTECIGPKPFEFYYIPKEILDSICEEYIYAYKIDSKQNLLDTIQILKDYCKNPIVDKYIEPTKDHPGYRGYAYPDNLEKELKKIIKPAENITLDKKESYEKSYNKLIEDVNNKFFEFLDMAGNFFNWNRDLNSFQMTIYLGPSPSSNKETVIENWKKYRNQDIEINEEQIKKEFYGEDAMD